MSEMAKWATGRRIAHMDLDAFFAAVEAIEDPSLVDAPVVVGAKPGTRGVVATCNYAARAYGIHSAMPINEAYRRCPQAVFLPVRHDLYRDYSRSVLMLVAGYAELVQPISIDEAFVDLSEVGDAVAVARELKGRIRSEVGLVASIGLATNKLVAKIATDQGKPDGFVVVPPGEEAAFLAPLPVGTLWGVGPKTALRLESVGIRTIGELAAVQLSVLVPLVGAHYARELLAHSRGVDDSPVRVERDVKSISEEVTFQRDEADRWALWQVLLAQADQCASRLQKRELMARTVTLKIRFGDFRTMTRSITLGVSTDEAGVLAEAAAALMRQWWAPEVRPLRLLGLRVSRLEPAPGARQLPLLSPEDHLTTTGVPMEAQSHSHLASSRLSPRHP